MAMKKPATQTVQASALVHGPLRTHVGRGNDVPRSEPIEERNRHR